MHSNKYIAAFLARRAARVRASAPVEPATPTTPSVENPDYAAIIGGAASTPLEPEPTPGESATSPVTLPEKADDEGDVARPVTPAAPELPMPTADNPLVTSFTSSNVVSAVLADGVVEVTFKDGKAYRYANFTPELMLEWKAAKSAGSWFHANVRMKADRHPVVGSSAPEKAEQAKG